jgi:protoheme IX farnesyltransferase
LTTDSSRLYRPVALAAVILTVGLITLGGIVRITGSGMGCGDHWPLCNGRIFPNLSDTLEVIEWSHRWVASILSFLILGLAIVGWTKQRNDARLRNPATLALVLLVVQVLLGALTVKLLTAAPAVVIHLSNAMLLLSVLVIALLRASTPERSTAPIARIHLATATAGFLTIVLGAFVANYDAGVYCLGFPLCGGAFAPPPTGLGQVQWVHRIFAYSFLGLALASFLYARKLPRASFRSQQRGAHAVLGLVLVQIAVAAAMILHLLPTSLRAVHLLVGSLLVAALVYLVYHGQEGVAEEKVQRTPEPVPADESGPRPTLAQDLVTLTKPRIISLLLVTTIAPMFITGHGVPPLTLILWVTLGGYLMAGGANTINMWFDRDIDLLMTRTRSRPVPSGRISALGALLFGLGQGAVAFAIFWFKVNPLSAWLALGGLLFYVFIYTIWLKRISAQNIVIGGAAGAFPPLVGWTAMTGQLDLAAIYLFAIIFFWTPPHFWALALVKQKDYANAGIPMMPVVAGDHWTKVQMLAYTLMLIPLTIMPSVFGALGLLYGAIAVGLGGRLLWYSIKVLREKSILPVAWKMYKYSLLYLFLLFIAMGVDRVVPFGHQYERAPILILDETAVVPPLEDHTGH